MNEFLGCAQDGVPTPGIQVPVGHVNLGGAFLQHPKPTDDLHRHDGQCPTNVEVLQGPLGLGSPVLVPAGNLYRPERVLPATQPHVQTHTKKIDAKEVACGVGSRAQLAIIVTATVQWTETVGGGLGGGET